jgi:cyclic pyranopterin phosphate synthase
MTENMTFLPKKNLLSLEELDRLCTNFIDLGIEKLRITGGEPLVRKNIVSFLRSISRHLVSGKLKELTLTTNGSQLKNYASTLADIGIKRINVSLDTLNEKKFTKITRWGKLDQVLEGIEKAKSVGLSIKINIVALKGTNEDEIHNFVKWCGNEDFDLTFIEVMPMGDLETEDRLDQYWSLTNLRKQLEKKWSLSDLAISTGGPARYVKVKETNNKIGFITPLSHNFCESCNRIRITCTGKLYMCLGQDDDADLLKIIRENPKNDFLLKEAIENAISRKPKGHDFDYSRQEVKGQMSRHMSHTGG